MKILIISLSALLALAPAGYASDPFGVGVSGGALLPVSQEDQGTGYLIAVKFRLGLRGPFVMEPNIHFGSYGDAEVEGVGSRNGASLKHYGIDVTYGNPIAKPGFKPYALLGGAIYNTKQDGVNTTNKSGWSFGGGVALGLRPELDVDIRGRFNIAGGEESTSRKSVELTIGVTYYFGLK